MNRRNNKRPALQKEKISIIAASVFVLSALTLAGVYMSSQGDRQKEENRQEQELVADTPLNFSDEDSLALPIIGDVLLDYSMDKAVYHTTMQQYRYNPSLVVAATEGQDITAAADGIVSDVYYDSQTGNTIRFDLGNGYMLTYGQLDSIALNPGDRVSAGDIVGKVAKPTIYYTEEGTNIYYKLTKDGKPVDPLHRSSDEEQ